MVFERLSRARRLRSMARLRIVIMSFLNFPGQNLPRFPPVDLDNGALVGKRLVAMLSPPVLISRALSLAPYCAEVQFAV